MNNYVYTKSHLLEKYTPSHYNQDYYTQEVVNDGPLVLDLGSSEGPDLINKKLVGLSSCFLLEESSGLGLARKKSIPCWRKLSEPLDKKYTPSFMEIREAHFSITSRPVAQPKLQSLKDLPHTKSHPQGEGGILSTESSDQGDGYLAADGILQLLIKKEENGQDNSHEFKINNLRHIKDNNKIEWYIHSDNFGFEFGPFKTDKLIEFYTNKLINQYTKIRLDPQYYDMITDGLKKNPLEPFVIKELCNVFSIKEKCSNKKPSFEEENNYKHSNSATTLKKKRSYDYGYGYNQVEYYSYDYHNAPKK
jgi:hypothetical protein